MHYESIDRRSPLRKKGKVEVPKRKMNKQLSDLEGVEGGLSKGRGTKRMGKWAIGRTCIYRENSRGDTDE